MTRSLMPLLGATIFQRVGGLGIERGEVDGEYVWTEDGAVMVYVPAGAFTQGSEHGVLPALHQPSSR